MSESPAAEGRLIPEWTLGDRLRKARRSVRMTTAEFAGAIEENPKTYGSWETDNSAPRHRDLLTMARRIEMLTRIPAAWIIGLDAQAAERNDLRSSAGIRQRHLTVVRAAESPTAESGPTPRADADVPLVRSPTRLSCSQTVA